MSNVNIKNLVGNLVTLSKSLRGGHLASVAADVIKDQEAELESLRSSRAALLAVLEPEGGQSVCGVLRRAAAHAEDADGVLFGLECREVATALETALRGRKA